MTDDRWTKIWEAFTGDPMDPKNNTEAGLRRVIEVVLEHASTPSPETHLVGLDLLRSEVEKLCTRDHGAEGELVSRASVLALIDLMTGWSHTDDLAVDRFATAMKAKLAKKREEGRGGWENPAECSIAFLSELLREHVGKGDPVDVGNLAMMIHQRGGVIE